MNDAYGWNLSTTIPKDNDDLIISHEGQLYIGWYNTFEEGPGRWKWKLSYNSLTNKMVSIYFRKVNLFWKRIEYRNNIKFHSLHRTPGFFKGIDPPSVNFFKDIFKGEGVRI
jgi:hypothetical protein